jgi:hypothetical protein
MLSSQFEGYPIKYSASLPDQCRVLEHDAKILHRTRGYHPGIFPLSTEAEDRRNELVDSPGADAGVI